MPMNISRKFVTTSGFIAALAFVLAAPPVRADKDWDYQCSDGFCRIGLETKDRVPELSMPGLGLSASAAQLKKRIAFAVDSGKISGVEADAMKKEAEDIGAQLAAIKDSGKTVTFEQGLALGRSISGINERLEKKVQEFRPQPDEKQALASAVSDIQLLNAQLKKRISENLAAGRLQASQARKLRKDASEIMERASGAAAGSEQLANASRDLRRLNIRMEREFSDTAVGYRGSGGSFLNFPRAL